MECTMYNDKAITINTIVAFLHVQFRILKKDLITDCLSLKLRENKTEYELENDSFIEKVQVYKYDMTMNIKISLICGRRSLLLCLTIIILE